jgi:formylglycine-generating enzyme required for sulfatase activity
MNDGAVVENDPQHVLRVYRGSSWGQSADELKVAIRWNEEPQIRGSYIGLRCARPSAVSP